MKYKILLPILLCLCSCGNNQTIKYKELEIITFQPFYYQSSKITESNPKLPLPEGAKSYGDIPSLIGKSLSKLDKNIKYNEEKSTKDVTLRHEDFNSLGKNQIIIFEGHGSCVWFDNEPHSVIWTGKDYDPSKKDTDEDYLNNFLVEAEGKEALTNYYIDNYCGDLTGSLIYLDNCFSGRDSNLAKTFLDKGAAAVIGHTNTTQQIYGNKILYETLMNLKEINPNTKTTNTIYEALSLAKEKFGKNDSVPMPFAIGSEPLLYGNPNWKISK